MKHQLLFLWLCDCCGCCSFFLLLHLCLLLLLRFLLSIIFLRFLLLILLLPGFSLPLRTGNTPGNKRTGSFSKSSSQHCPKPFFFFMVHFRMLASQTLRGMIAELTGMDVARLGIQMLGPSALICFTKDGRYL